jgi:MHS family proline/betaine transporter-like MFS transporter
MSSISKSRFWSAWLGNFFEHYDTALFGFLSPFLAPLIFPDQEPVTALILTYAMIPLGMLARPLGAVFFGYIGDAYGRIQALFLTLAGMSVISGCIAISPTFEQAGILSPIIFCLGRILQNFLASGETMGGAIFLLENTQEKHKDLFSSLYSASTIGGFILASAGVSLITYYGIVEWGWRLLYVLGCVTGLFGCLIRSQIKEKSFASFKSSSYSFSELMQILWAYRKLLLIIAISSGFAYANYSIALVLMNGIVPLATSLTKEQMINLNTMLLVLDFSALPFFGWLASKITREKMMLYASLSVSLSAIPLFFLLDNASFMSVVGIRIWLVMVGVAFFAPFHAWAQQIVPAAYRYLIISFGYALGSQLFGGPTAAVSIWLYKVTGMTSSAAWYWWALALINSFMLLQAFRIKNLYFPIQENISLYPASKDNK